jgi:hexosaminidase
MVTRIVKHAAARGVRLIPEFDVPGHAYAGYDAIANLTVCGNHQPWTETCVEPPCGQLDITHPSAAKVYDGLLGDVAALFPDEYVHTGGDEVNYDCWNSSDTMKAYVQQHYGDLSKDSWNKLWNTFQKTMLQSAAKRKRTVIQWEGAFKSGLDMGPKATVQAWLGPAAIASATSAGHQVIASDYNYWYLDCGTGNWVTGNGSWCNPYKNWPRVYAYEPTDMGGGSKLTPEQEALIIGGEVALWSETIDGNNLHSKAWPRTCAAAERLWSDKSINSWEGAYFRIMWQSERMRRRGVPQTVQAPRWCLTHPGECIYPGPWMTEAEKSPGPSQNVKVSASSRTHRKHFDPAVFSNDNFPSLRDSEVNWGELKATSSAALDSNKRVRIVYSNDK